MVFLLLCARVGCAETHLTPQGSQYLTSFLGISTCFCPRGGGWAGAWTKGRLQGTFTWQVSDEALELIPGRILLQNLPLQTAQHAGVMSDCAQTAGAGRAPQGRAVNGVGGLFPGSPPLGLAKAEPEGWWEWLAQRTGCLWDPHPPSKMPPIASPTPGPLSGDSQLQRAGPLLRYSWLRCSRESPARLEEAFVCQGGQRGRRLLLLCPGPRPSAAPAGTVSSLSQVGRESSASRHLS